jgi:hypothetical protein
VDRSLQLPPPALGQCPNPWHSGCRITGLDSDLTGLQCSDSVQLCNWNSNYISYYKFWIERSTKLYLTQIHFCVAQSVYNHFLLLFGSWGFWFFFGMLIF